MLFTQQKIAASNTILISLTDSYGEAYNSESLLKLIEESTRAAETTFIFNFEAVDIKDSDIFRPLLACYQRLQRGGGTLKVRGLEGVGKEVFELLTLDRLIPVDEEL